MKHWADKNVEEYGLDIPLHLAYTPTAINVIAIGIFTVSYKIVVNWLVNRENHRYQNTWEDSLINKWYMF